MHGAQTNHHHHPAGLDIHPHLRMTQVKAWAKVTLWAWFRSSLFYPAACHMMPVHTPDSLFLLHSINKETQRLEFHLNAILIMTQWHGIKHSESNGCLNMGGIILSIWCIRVSHLLIKLLEHKQNLVFSQCWQLKKPIIHKGNKVSNNMWFPPKKTYIPSIS